MNKETMTSSMTGDVKEPAVEAPVQHQAGDGHATLLSRQETREILTPFAFEINKTLFGTRLASPYKRGFAILIDLMAIAILSSAPGELLAIVVAITFYRLGNEKRAKELGRVKGTRRRKFARFVGAFIILILLLDWLPALLEPTKTQPPEVVKSKAVEQELNLEKSLILAGVTQKLILAMDQSQCDSLSCWQSTLTPQVASEALVSLDLSQEIVKQAINGLAETTELPLAEQSSLEQHLVEQYELARREANKQDEPQTASSDATDSAIVEASEHADTTVNDVFDQQLPIKTEKEKPIYSIVEYIKALIDDLGLGFGWAAFYFTVLTALWQGQTLGKKVFAIKVLQLDGTPLTLWDSFGRYGGYGAGLATGLLGFLQIFWNANRQGIHDKISATVVVEANTKTNE